MSDRKRKHFSFPHPIIRSPGIPKKYVGCYPCKLPPYSYQPFVTDGCGVPCPHIFRPTCYVLGDSPTLNSWVPLGAIVQPLGPCCIEVPTVREVLWCEGCGTPLMSGMCGVCGRVQEVGMEGMKVLQQVEGRAVVDYVIGEQEGQRRDRYVFVIEVSQQIKIHLDAIKQNIKFLESTQEVEIGFVFYDTKVMVIDGQSEEPNIMVIADLDNPTENPLTENQMFISVSKQPEKLQRIIETLVSYSESSQNRLSSCFGSAIDLVSHHFSNCKILVFASQQPTIGTYKPPLQKDPLQCTVPKTCLQRSLAIYLFLFGNGLNRLFPLSHQTGGSIFQYRSNNEDQFYYDLHTVLHGRHVMNVEVEVKTKGWVTKCIVTDKNVVEGGKFRLATLGEERNFTLCFEPGKVQAGTIAGICVLVRFTEGGVRKLRVIQFSFPVVKELPRIFESIGDQAYFFVTLRRLMSQQSKQATPALQLFTKSLKTLLSKHKQICLSPYDFSIPSCLKFTCFYLAQLSKRQFFSSPPITFHKYSTLNLQTLSKDLYMKLYKVDQTQTVMKNLKLQAHRIELEGIYLVDAGRVLYVMVGEEVGEGRVSDVMGVRQVADIDGVVDITLTGTRANQRFREAVDMLRRCHINGFLRLKGLREGSKENHRVLGSRLYDQDGYKRFLNKLL